MTNKMIKKKKRLQPRSLVATSWHKEDLFRVVAIFDGIEKWMSEMLEEIE